MRKVNLESKYFINSVLIGGLIGGLLYIIICVI